MHSNRNNVARRGDNRGRGFISKSPPLSGDVQSPESPPGPRKAIVLREHDLDDYKSSSEEESVESDDSDRGGGGDHDGGRKGGAGPSGSGSGGGGGSGGGDLYYDHSPGEVYTIPEEEDEGGSPTGGDLVTSLKHQQGM